MQASAELRERIRGWLAEYLARPGLERELRDVAAFGALPLFQDASGCLALRPDGTVVAVVWAQPEASFREASPAFRVAARVAGRATYPELQELLPLRASDAEDCANCDGEGLLSDGGFCGVCHGLGFAADPS